MKKRKLSLMILLAACLGIQAQNAGYECPVKTFEFEARIGGTYPLSKNNMNNLLGPQLGVEARWNLKRLPIDLGAELNISSAAREMNTSAYAGETSWENFSARTITLGGVAHYNFNLGRNVSTFVGAGLGLGLCDMVEQSDGKTSLVFSPRIGVELWNQLRLTADLRLSRREYNTVGLTIGYTFGGRKIKK